VRGAASRFSIPGLPAAFVATVLAAPARAAAIPDPTPIRPNIVFVLVDDLRWDEVHYPFVRLPNLQRLEREGVRFRNAFVTTPLCSPSRASFLTGQYAHRHGILDNTDRSPRSHELVTFPRLLHDAGYETAFLGKWHMGLDDRPRPGFDHWVSVPGQGRYEDPELNVNGERKVVPGYFTDVLSDFAVDFLKRPHTKPFLLFLAHKAVHPDVIQRADGSVANLRADTFIPAARHEELYAGAEIPHRPNYARPPTGKPALLRKIGDLPPLGRGTVTSDDTILKRLRMLQAVDEGLGRMLEVLDNEKKLDDTLVVFTSDEGFFYGEHGLSEERRLAYEESVRIPLVMRWPKLIAPGGSLDPPVLGLDLAPTLLEIGGAPERADMHGRSLVPLLRGEKVAWRDAFLVEYFSDTVFPRVLKMGYQAVRTGRWTYIHYAELEGMDELYDRETDPYQMTNRIDDPAAGKDLDRLKAERERLLRESP
jgi:arylsulfatase A-like enzyme